MIVGESGDIFEPPGDEPVEIHPHYDKLYILCGIFALLAFFCVRGALYGPPTASGMLWILAAGAIAAAVLIWRRAASRAPVVVIGPEGIEDHRFGFIPWKDIGRWKHSRSLINPGFGWNLAEGASPPRNQVLFRLGAALNLLGGVGQRTYRRKMILGGLDPVAAAFRKHHPRAEAG